MIVDLASEVQPVPKQNPISKPYKCSRDGCNKSFCNTYEIKRHSRAHRKDTLPKREEEFDSKKIYKCNEAGCSQRYTRHWSLTCHKRKRHPHIQSKLGNESEPFVGEKKCESTKNYRCDEPGCGAWFLKPDRLRIHKLTIHCGERPFTCDYEGCNRSYRSDFHLKRHKISSHSSDTAQQVICGVEGCGQIYCNKYVLSQHIANFHIRKEVNRQIKKRSDIEKRHKCDEPGCEAAFKRPYRLKNHKLTSHCGLKPYKCNYKNCNKSYTNESHLSRHKTMSHFSEMDTTKEVMCSVGDCGNIFANKYSLKKHISTYHKTYPFACKECDQKFRRKSELHTHQVEVHGAEIPYKCDKCPKKFTHYHLFNKHLKTHKTYKCDCENTFSKWSKFLEHRRTDCTVQKKEHKCIICGKILTSKHQLTKHSLFVHLPDSQIDFIKCPYLNCKYSYKYKSSLRCHIRTYHEKIFGKIKCTEKNCELVFKSNRNLKQHLRTIHNGLKEKIRKPRRPRKDKGKPKISMASKISGVEVSTEENFRNIVKKIDQKKGDLKVVLTRIDISDYFKNNDKLRSNSDTRNETEKSKDCEGNSSVNTNEILKNDHDTATVSDIDSECLRIHSVVEVTTENESQKPRNDPKILDINKNQKNPIKSTDFLEDDEKGSEELKDKINNSQTVKYMNKKNTRVTDEVVECAEQPLEIEAMTTRRNTSRSEEEIIKNSDTWKNQKSSKSQSVDFVEDCDDGKQEIIGDQNSTTDISNNVLVVSMDLDSESSKHPIVLEISSEVSELKNDGSNNSDDNRGENSSGYKTVKILETNAVEFIGNKNATGDFKETQNANQELDLNMDSSLINSSQSSCDSGVIIFDFPEFGRTDRCNNIEATTEENTEEQFKLTNVEDCNSASYISDEEKLKKRLVLMLKDIHSVVKHLEKDEN